MVGESDQSNAAGVTINNNYNSNVIAIINGDQQRKHVNTVLDQKSSKLNTMSDLKNVTTSALDDTLGRESNDFSKSKDNEQL